MMTEEMQKKYEEFVESGLAAKEEAERIAGQPDPEMRTTQEQANLDEAKYQEEWGKHRTKVHENIELDFGKIFTKSTLQTDEVTVLERARIMEAALDTIDYLGWLRGKKIEAKLDADNYLSGFYQSRHDRFIKENTP